MTPVFHSHSCPNCGHRANWSRLYLKSWVWARWSCECCGQTLGFDSRQRRVVGLFFGVYAGYLGFLLHKIGMIHFLVLMLIGAIAAFRFDRIRSEKIKDLSCDNLSCDIGDEKLTNPNQSDLASTKVQLLSAKRQ